LLVIDETQGRKAAGDRGLTVTGTIGVLEAAAKRRLVRLEDEFERLKRMGFRVNPKLLDARLALFREGQREPARGWGSGSTRSSWMLDWPCSEKASASPRQPRGRIRNRNSQKRRNGTATKATSNEGPDRGGCQFASLADPAS
jgi:hypothetical protein